MSKLPQEAEYMLKVIKGIINDEEIPMPSDEINFEKIYNLSKAHGVTSIVYTGLQLSGADIPEDTAKKFSVTDKLMIISSAARNSAADDLRIYFKKNSIDYVFLKGSNLQKLYPRNHMRYSADIDVLVKESDFQKASQLLKSIGYQLSSRNEKHDVFVNPPYVCIELHKLLTYDESFFQSPWKYAKNKNGSKHELIFVKEFELIYLVYHAAKNLKKTAGIGIHSVIDLWLFMKKNHEELDMDFINRSLEELKIKKFFLAILDLSEIWFGNKETNNFYNKLTLIILSGARTGNISNLASSQMREKASLFAKMKFIWGRVFLPYKDMKKIYPSLKKIPFTLPFYWVARIFVLLFKKRHHGTKRVSEVIKNSNQKKAEAVSQIYDELGL